jgi:cyclic pyranopterin phosphate synthase
MSRLTHLDEHGAARMVDVSAKESTLRQAEAEAVIALSQAAFDAVLGASVPKGDVLAAARIAGILAAKKTAELIPLCHSVPIAAVTIEIEPLAGRTAFRILTCAKTKAETGVEMEALTAAAVAALTVYDMTKSMDRSARIDRIRLISKSGGKSGTYSAAPE